MTTKTSTTVNFNGGKNEEKTIPTLHVVGLWVPGFQQEVPRVVPIIRGSRGRAPR